jgi:hypothetical protein
MGVQVKTVPLLALAASLVANQAAAAEYIPGNYISWTGGTCDYVIHRPTSEGPYWAGMILGLWAGANMEMGHEAQRQTYLAAKTQYQLWAHTGMDANANDLIAAVWAYCIAHPNVMFDAANHTVWDKYPAPRIQLEQPPAPTPEPERAAAPVLPAAQVPTPTEKVLKALLDQQLTPLN